MGQTSTYSRERLRTWAMDVIHMKKGTDGHSYILTALDVATSWMEAWPIRRATANKVAEIIEWEMIPRYGEGLTFITDQGREFTGRVVKQAVRDSRSIIHYGTAYHSQSNPVERFHRTLEGVIRCLLIDQKRNATQWPMVLSDALRTVRSAPDTLTKESPFLRVFGIVPRDALSEWINEGAATPGPSQPQGGFSFEPSKSNRKLDVTGPQVYPESNLSTSAKAANPANPAEIAATRKRQRSDKMKTGSTAESDKAQQNEIAFDNPVPDDVTVLPYQDGEEFHQVTIGQGISETLETGENYCRARWNGTSRVLTKMPTGDPNRKDHFLRQVFALEEPIHIEGFQGTRNSWHVQESAQAAKDEADRKRHEYNAKRHAQQHPDEWFPLKNELVDWAAPTDDENPNTRKLRDPYKGPYVVLNRDLVKKKVIIKNLDLETRIPWGRCRTVNVGTVRPTLAFEFLSRPRGRTWTPDELWSQRGDELESSPDEEVATGSQCT